MDINLDFALLESLSILIFGIVSLIMVDVTLERKYDVKKSGLIFAGIFLFAFILIIPIRLYVDQYPNDLILTIYNTHIYLTNIVRMLAELLAILIVTIFVYLAVLKSYKGKHSAKLFVAAFTTLIGVIISTFLSDYAILAYQSLTDVSSATLEYKVTYVVLQAILLALGFILYNFWIKSRVKKLIADTNGEMERFVWLPMGSYFIFVAVTCVWYVVGDILQPLVRLQYFVTSIALQIIYILIFRVIFTEISVVAESMKTESELNSAKLIQTAILPNSDFNGKKGINIAATMIPAREVGGDFYDFFELDNQQIAFMIADVSGKGIPAALFMMHAHTVIKNNLMVTKSPAEALIRSNAELLKNNDSCMFVTTFVGVLDLKSGIMTYANAGHNPPLVKKQTFERLKVKKQPVLGVVSVAYENSELPLDQNDILLLYTDGVTEAMNEAGEEYGEQRLIDLLNEAAALDVKDLVNTVNSDVNAFSKQAPDDITMVMLEYTGTATKLTVPAEDQSLVAVQTLLSDLLETDDQKLKSAILVAVEEVFVNIVHYAYPQTRGKVCVIIDTADDLQLQFIDQGIPFNPLAMADPDPSLPLKDRAVGGYGIYLVKQLMDEFSYIYSDGKNMVTLKKMMS